MIIDKRLRIEVYTPSWIKNPYTMITGTLPIHMPFFNSSWFRQSTALGHTGLIRKSDPIIIHPV